MDRRERIQDAEETTRMAQDGHQARIWTALPGIIQLFDSGKLTCTVQPAISGSQRNQDGTSGQIKMPLLLDCPVVFPGGGGVTLTFPLTAGDECLVVFASRCIDSWWQLGGVQGQAEIRMHDLSDGFVIPGPRSQPRKITAAASAQLRTDDGVVYIQINGSGITLHGNVTVQGNLTWTGTAKGQPGVDLTTHKHADPQGGTTGTPTA